MHTKRYYYFYNDSLAFNSLSLLSTIDKRSDFRHTIAYKHKQNVLLKQKKKTKKVIQLILFYSYQFRNI